MADYTVSNDNYDEIEFLESEIEDDDAEAPLGVLIVNDNGKVKPFVRDTSADETPVVVDGTPEDEVAQATSAPIAEEQPAPAEETPEVAVEETPAPAVEQATVVAEEAPATEAASEPEAQEEQVAVADEQPSPEDIAAYAIVYNPDRADATVNAAIKQEEPAPAAVEETPAVSEQAPVEETPVVAEVQPAPVAEAPAADAASEPAPAVEEKPATAKKAAPRKKAATVTIQKAASADDVWGAAVIAPVKKSAAKKTPADSEDKDKETPRTKEEKPVAKKEEKAAPAAKADAKETKTEKSAKAPVKAKEEPKAAKTTAKAPAKAKEEPKAAKSTAKTPAKAKEETKAAKPATKAAENAEQVIEEGDNSAPHGKFVIKKTDNGNFVYKLYSSNHRVVAIGAGLYTSIASCKSGINSVRNNAESAPVEDQTLQKWEEKKFPKWQIYFDKKGEVRLRLLASNGNIVATTNDGYLSRDAAKKGIEAIARAAKGSSIVRNDDLW